MPVWHSPKNHEKKERTEEEITTAPHQLFQERKDSPGMEILSTIICPGCAARSICVASLLVQLTKSCIASRNFSSLFSRDSCKTLILLSRCWWDVYVTFRSTIVLPLPNLFGTPWGFNGTLFSFCHEDNGGWFCVSGVSKVEPWLF